MTDRCQGCAHPLAEGEWTRCDAECRHGEVVRFVNPAGSLCRAEPIDATVGQLLAEAPGSMAQAHGRARAEEHDCPECDGEGYTFGLFGLADSTGILEHRRVPCEPCSSSGRVRPMLCQACERSDDRG